MGLFTKFRKQIVIFCIFVFSLFILVMGGELYFQFGIEKPYQQFRTEEEKTIPLFDALNDEVYNQIPLPPGIEKINEHRGGLQGAYHGRYLWIDYCNIENKFIDTQAITTYFNDYFLSNGWEKYKKVLDSNELLFYRGTSCYKIVYFKYKYSAIIEHDYFKQTFSLSLPPIWIIHLNEYGESNFTHCPPDPYARP